MPYNSYPYELPPLPFPYDALEPYIDAEMMHYHHDKHFQTYINNLNDVLQKYPALQSLTLEQLLRKQRVIPANDWEKILHNGGGVYNHSLFFNNLAPANMPGHEPDSALMNVIDRMYGSFDKFKAAFTQQALDVFGSGWTVLALTTHSRIRVVNLANQETLLTEGAMPIMLFDVWEHAYYLKYKNLRADYVSALWNVITFPRDSQAFGVSPAAIRQLELPR